MAIETICSGCAKKLRVGDEHAGKQARCPECGTIYTVPSATAGTRSVFDDLATTETKPKSPSGGTSLFDDLGVDAPGSSSSRSPAPFANPPAKDTSERWLMKIEDGREFGPVDRATLDQWYAERRIGPTTQLRREYDSQWQPARNVYPGLGAAMAPAAPTPGANPFAEQPQNPYATSYSPGGGARAYREAHRGPLILTFALLGWFVCLFFGIAAWVMGASDLDKMKRGVMDPSGEGLTRAGMIIGIIATVMALIGVGFFVLFMIIGIAAGG